MPQVFYPLPSDSRILCIDEFLRLSQCHEIIEELNFAYWRPSAVTDHGGGGNRRSIQSPMRVSESAMQSWFPIQMRPILRRIDSRLAKLVPHFSTRREDWQATRYVKGGKFDYHHDAGPWKNEPSGDREYTALIYLNTPRGGGSTNFREIGLDVKAQAGRLLLWRNLTRGKNLDMDMIHSGVPLRSGSKKILVTWVRQRRIRGRLHEEHSHQ